jgi:hypothetical protein
MWYSTEDTYDIGNTEAHYSYGDTFHRLHIEKSGHGKWLVLICVKSPPRDELGNFSFDFWPDDDECRYTIKASSYLKSKASAREYAKAMDVFCYTNDDPS